LKLRDERFQVAREHVLNEGALLRGGKHDQAKLAMPCALKYSYGCHEIWCGSWRVPGQY